MFRVAVRRYIVGSFSVRWHQVHCQEQVHLRTVP
jgi:hypothetical protein